MWEFWCSIYKALGSSPSNKHFCDQSCTQLHHFMDWMSWPSSDVSILMSSRTLISYAQLGAAGTEMNVFVPALTLPTHKLQTGPADLSPGLKLFTLALCYAFYVQWAVLGCQVLSFQNLFWVSSLPPDTLPDLGWLALKTSWGPPCFPSQPSHFHTQSYFPGNLQVPEILNYKNNSSQS